MSAIDIDGAVQASAGPGRAGARGAAAPGSDDGAFGALMADLHTAPDGAAPGKAPRDAAAETSGKETSKTKETPAKAGTSDAQGLDDLLSQVLAGTQETGEPAAGKPDAAVAPHGEKGRKAREAADQAALSKAMAGTTGSDATTTLDGDDPTQAQGTSHGRPKAAGTAQGPQAKVEAGAAPDATAGAQAALQVAAVQAEADQTAAEAQAGQEAAAGAAAEVAAETEQVPVDVPTMRVKVLSRETHFAPVRTFTLSPEGGPGAGSEKAASAANEEDGMSRADAFAASPRERAALRLEQARLQDQGAASDGVVAANAEADTATDSTEALLSGTDAPGGASGGLPGSLPLNSLKQVSNAIGAEVARLVDPAFVSDADTAASARAGGPLRLIAIQLQPLELGTVTVRMRLSDDGLDVRISASNPATARMLQQDQARLADLLKAQGIDAANVTVTSPSDQAAAWSRFEILPKGTSSGFAGQGEGERPSGQQPEQQNSGDGRDEGENASGGRRSGRNRG